MSLELWGGLECTVNRVGDAYFDQIERTGHQQRLHDLDLVAALGIKTLRYPVLWERTEREGALDWTWSDSRLTHLRNLGLNPIVGLLHHGSGPSHTSLVDPNFPKKFSNYAAAVARRYPWVENYTPINEPLTTARFSGLYGHWYPHGKSSRIFARALLQQCRAIVLAMRAIREVNPRARFIQTEDLGKTFSTPLLAGQANFENERRWLTFDLLCGRVHHRHPLWNYLVKCEIEEADLQWFIRNPCRPDILGVNHYLTSDRYLDHRVDLFPTASLGGNKRYEYADVEAVRVDLDGDLGPGARLAEIWQRFRLPVAVTEVHLGSSPDEQVRWFQQVWYAAQRERGHGSDIVAVTAWALFGSFDWNSLVVRSDNIYESGVFDVRHEGPSATALAEMVKELADGRRPSNPQAYEPGWWQKPERIFYRPDRFLPIELVEHTVRASV